MRSPKNVFDMKGWPLRTSTWNSGLGLFIAALVFLPGAASAGNGEGLLVGDFTTHAGPPANTAFSLSARVNAAPPCATSDRFVTNSKELMTLVLAAKLAGKKLRAYGTGVCDVWPDSETVWAVQIID